jgi:hypothetical protein
MVGPPEFRGSYCAGGVALSRPKQMFEFESLFLCANRRHSSRQRWHQSSIAFMIPPMKCTTPSAGAPVGPAVPAPVQQRTQWSVVRHIATHGARATRRGCCRAARSTRRGCCRAALLHAYASPRSVRPKSPRMRIRTREIDQTAESLDRQRRLAARARLMRSYRCALRVVRHTVDRMMQAYRRSGRNNRCVL